MTAKLYEFNGVTTLDIPADRVLKNAPKGMKELVLVGYDADGEFYFASNLAGGPNVLWLLAKAERALLEIGE